MCSHPENHQRYEQLNQYPSTPIEDILGTNYFIWRVVYCRQCKKILQKIGPVPEYYDKYEQVSTN